MLTKVIFGETYSGISSVIFIEAFKFLGWWGGGGSEDGGGGRVRMAERGGRVRMFFGGGSKDDYVEKLVPSIFVDPGSNPDPIF